MLNEKSARLKKLQQPLRGLLRRQVGDVDF
jgi:hypothetical protein